MRATTILLGITFLLGVVSPAGAVIVTVDPDDFALLPPGTDISALVPGVTLATRLGRNPGNEIDVFAVTSLVSPFSNWVFGHSADPASPAYGKSWGGGKFSPPDYFEYFEARFDTPTDWVSLDFIRNNTGDARGYLLAYNESGIEIARIFTADLDLNVGVTEILTVSMPSATISYIVASWDDAQRCCNGELDNLRFEAIPEPSSIVIWCLIGLTCGMLRYRRKRRAAI